MAFIPSEEILNKYAEVLINFALNGGKGINKGETVVLQVPESAKPLLKALRRTVLKAGANMITEYLAEDVSKEYFELANDEQLSFMAKRYMKGKVDDADHFVFIDCTTDKHELETIPPEKIMFRQRALKPYKEWREEKENQGKMTWTLALYGTEAMAKEAGISQEKYWEQIIKACYLDSPNPIEEWKRVLRETERIKSALDALKIDKLRVQSEGTDLTVGLGPGRVWLGGSGRNIPSFELFISPDARRTEGKIHFDLPLYRYGNLIENVELEFKEGRVISAKASKGENIIKEMIAVEGADRIGEFSLTDKRFSRIDTFMAETLFDENFGGPNGNTHVALGSAYKDSYPGDPSKLSKEEWNALGYNDSVIHTDIIATKNRTVTAFLPDGTEKVIYKDGMFTI